MKTTVAWLKKNDACEGGIKWFSSCGKTDSVEVMEKLVAEGLLEWANWFIARLLNRKNQIRYAVFAAEQALDAFEKLNPNDDRPRKAIEAANAVILSDIKETRAAARSAGAAARSAGAAAWAARDAARAARDAAIATDAASMAAAWAARDAWAADRESGDAMLKKNILYGLDLHKKEVANERA